MEVFSSIQGEGYHTGKPAIFLRIGGCDVGCHWCDIKESWNPNLHVLTEIHEIAEKIFQSNLKDVVITGGEPLNYNLTPLCTLLKEKKYKTYLETSGTQPLTGIWDWICFSPKRQQSPEDIFFSKANELKIIIFDEADFIMAEQYASKIQNQECVLFMQPEWSKRQQMSAKIVSYILEHPSWKMSNQIHKYINIP